jgi:site-specific DNA-methyltransferase (adenine-specific)
LKKAEEMNELMGKIHHIDCLEFMKQVPDNYFDLIIADPPYFEVKGEFDFIWKTFDDFLGWIELLAIEFKRVLSDKGSLYVYGHAKKIAYKQVIFDKYFNLENHIVWEKTVCQTKIGIDNFRSFAPIKEHILFYSKEIGMTGLEFIDKEYIAPRNPFAKELKKARLKKGVSINEVAEYGKFYGNVNHGGAVTNWERGYNVPQKEQWEILCENLPIERAEYEDLRAEYEDLRRPFNNTYRLEDVMKFDQEATVTGKYAHPTQKPPKLSKALISTSTRPDSKVYIPFIGSGVEAEQCKSLGLDWCGTEIDSKYVAIANKRLSAVQGSLF